MVTVMDKIDPRSDKKPRLTKNKTGLWVEMDLTYDGVGSIQREAE